MIRRPQCHYCQYSSYGASQYAGKAAARGASDGLHVNAGQPTEGMRIYWLSYNELASITVYKAVSVGCCCFESRAHLKLMVLSGALRKRVISDGSKMNTILWLSRRRENALPNCSGQQGAAQGGLSQHCVN
eukprot:GHUV01038249.1.p1 GENE.GHUV01038249.1~~GHUV01038249.1.p1  ORF type:complete len:131 (-),score=21.82 GHUV01038249.1:171-563(-)